MPHIAKKSKINSGLWRVWPKIVNQLIAHIASGIPPFTHPMLTSLTDAEKVSHLLGINSVDLIKVLIKPRIRVGTEYVQQGRNMEQVVYSIGALSKSMYERMFTWIVKRVNKTLDTKVWSWIPGVEGKGG